MAEEMRADPSVFRSRGVLNGFQVAPLAGCGSLGEDSPRIRVRL
jgi:hypothetical protein